MSHTVLLETLDTGAVWSVARGLARSEAAYKGHLTECDVPRRNNLDGRGNLSEEALASFPQFFLATCIGQVRFMDGLTQPERLRTRILLWAFGPKRKCASTSFRRKRAAFSTRFFIGVNCRAATLPEFSASLRATRVASCHP